MEIIRDTQFVAEDLKGASVAIGNFDGVHLGHQYILDLAKRDNLPLGVLTFEPHPREVFAPNAPPFRLMSAAARANRLEKLGIERLYELHFTKALAQLEPEAFVKEILVDGIGVKHVVVGADFCFGKNRTGNLDVLKAFGETYGFDVTGAALRETHNTPISSTAIRKALSDGAPERAAEMLGHWHRIEGPVLHGEKRGRELGYPTANMSLEGLHLPKLGVYAVQVDILEGPDQGSYGGVASLGIRPMFELEMPNLETHLFDFSGDLYGKALSIALVSYLRPEMKFDGLEALITQMDADSALAREKLAAL